MVLDQPPPGSSPDPTAELRQQFLQAWQNGQTPRIEDYLRLSPPQEQDRLFRDLFSIEIRCRLERDERPLLEEYTRRFPDRADWLAAQTLPDNLHPTRQPTLLPSPIQPSGGHPAPPVAGYELLEELGRGGMGVVYRARDPKLLREVAIKQLLPGSPVKRFIREARLAASLQHPNVCAVFDYGPGEAGGSPFLVMELVRGQTLTAYASTTPPLRERIRVAADLAEALAFAHKAGIVHRDVKPSNVMVTSHGHVKVLDFGLARQVGAANDLTIPGTLLGTWKYLSPEQGRGELAGPPTDVFAFGILFYELLTGEHPFPARCDLSDPRSRPAPTGQLPPPLEDLLLSTLLPDPARRPTAAEIVARLRGASGGRGVVPPVPARPGPVTVGRDEPKARLIAHFEAARRGRGRLIGVAGEAGLGKTALVEQFLDELIRSEAVLVARGRCSERLAGTGAYLPLLEALEDLSKGAARQTMARLFDEKIPTWAALLGHRSDQSQSRPPVDLSAPPVDLLKRELTVLLGELDGPQPLILLLEDVHWADLSTLDLLAHLAPRLEGVRMLILLTYRTAELPATLVDLRRSWLSSRALVEMPLDFLDVRQLTQLLELTFPGNRFPPTFAELLHARTEGNPLFAHELIRYFRDRGGIRETAGGWALTSDLSAFTGDLPDSVAKLIERKLGRLADADRSLLLCAAVQGVEFDSLVLARAGECQGDPDAVEERLRALQCEHLIQFVSNQEFPGRELSMRFRFVHVLYQNALYNSLRPRQCRAMSKRVADALLAVVGAQTEGSAASLAILFEGAGDWEQAARFFRQAADAAAHAHGFEESLLLGRRGLKALEHLPPGAARDGSEVALLELVAHAAQERRGYASEEVRVACERGLELSRALPGAPVPHVLSVLLYFWHHSRGQMRQALSVAEDLLARAEAAGDVAGQRTGHFALGMALFYRGDYAAALSSLDRSLGLGVSGSRSRADSLRVLSPVAVCPAFAALALWNLGRVEESRARWPALLALAEVPSLPPSTKAIAFIVMGMVARTVPDPVECLRYAEQALRIIEEHRMQHLRTVPKLLRGWAWTQGVGAEQADEAQRRALLEEGIRDMTEGEREYRQYGSLAALPWFLQERAEALGLAKRPAEGLPLLDEADQLQQLGLDHRMPETFRLRGRLRRDLGRPADEVEQWYRRAMDLAERHGAKFYRLAAARELADLWRQTNRRDEARRLLEEALEAFPAGADTPELSAARRELGEL